MRIALTGYSRTGKDAVGEILVSMGFTRKAMGDIIKQQLDQLVREHLGFSAFTENDKEKRLIRELLVHWGYANYPNIYQEYFANLPEYCVNTRIFRLQEAIEWALRGGVIWGVHRPGVIPAEVKEYEEIVAIKEHGLISAVIENDGTLEDLRIKTMGAFLKAIQSDATEVPRMTSD